MFVDKYEIAAVIVPRSMLVCILPRGIFRDTAPHDNFSSSAPLQHMPPPWPDALLFWRQWIVHSRGVSRTLRCIRSSLQERLWKGRRGVLYKKSV